MTAKIKKRVSKAEWLERALKVLEKDGINEVKIDRLARELNVSRSGCYWHFKNRKALIRAMIEYWGSEFTSVVVNATTTAHDVNPKERLFNVLQMVIDSNLNRFEVPMRAAASMDPAAMEMVCQIYQLRLDYIRSILVDMGFVGDDLEMRTHLFVCYQTWEDSMFVKLSKADRSRWLKLRVELLCSEPSKTS